MKDYDCHDGRVRNNNNIVTNIIIIMVVGSIVALLEPLNHHAMYGVRVPAEE